MNTFVPMQHGSFKCGELVVVAARRDAGKSTLVNNLTSSFNKGNTNMTTTNPLNNIIQWHRDARPSVTDRDLTMAVAVHMEEFLEMLEQIDLAANMGNFNAERLELAQALDEAEASLRYVYKLLRHNKNAIIELIDREAVLDSIADQIVTATGVGVAANMDVMEAVKRVSDSNDSKRLSDGTFQRDETGKITKPAHYVAPDLTGLY